MEFTQIHNNLFKLGNEEAKLISVIRSWSKNNKEHLMSQEEYCERYYTSVRTYCRVLKKLKDNEIIEVVRRLPNNRQVLRINEDQLEFVLDKGYTATVTQPPCQSGSTTLPKGQYVTAKEAQPNCQTGTTHILDKVLDNNTIKNTIKNTIGSSHNDEPEEFSFNSFKEGAKKEDINLKDELMVLSILNEIDI